MYTCRLSYSSDNDQYVDAPNVSVTTGNFGNLSSLANLGGIFNNSGLINYFVDRGYTVDVNLQAAPYDWRLGAGRLF